MRLHLLLLVLPALLPLVLALPDPVYTLHYLKHYLREQVEKSFGCGKAIVYGTYIHPMGPVDGLYGLLNGNMFGFNSRCQRPDTYVKIFGNAQNYELLVEGSNSVLDQIVNAISRSSVRKVIVEWKYLPEEGKRDKAREFLQRLVSDMEARGLQVYLKAPASYFCLEVSGKKYILDLPVSRFIVELYGEEAGKYITYDSIFGVYSHSPDTGYSQNCPKFPTRTNLAQAAPQKEIYFEKTLDPHEAGFIGSNWESFLEKAGEKEYGGVYFYDGFPLQAVDL